LLASNPLLLSDRALTFSRPIKRVYQTVRSTVVICNTCYWAHNFLVDPPTLESDIGIRCATFWGDSGTNYLLAIIDIGATIRKIQTVQLSGITG
jgi:hypothetical protein